MDLSIQKLSKTFNQRTVFHELSFSVPSGARFAITGSNGSGKSTLLKILSGGMLSTSGTVQYELNQVEMNPERIYKYVHVVAPYNTVVEELTLPELFTFHKDLQTLSMFDRYKDWIDRIEYKFDPEARIKTFSSGMKQRIKLGIAMLDNRPLILVDEPTTNLDIQGKEWFFRLAANLSTHQTLVIASNDSEEIACCQQRLDLNVVS
jgi:ABC-type multidrug transport system ATPase subunit